MRQIKFRAWDGKTMLYSENNLGDFFGDQSPVCSYGDDEVSKDIILMEFTGLNDWKGKNIYEGDILKFKEFGKEYFAIVMYSTMLTGFRAYAQDGGDKYLSNLNQSEVIGNKYEHPDLIQKQSSKYATKQG